MHKAINAKFKKGDKVVSAGGNPGVVTEVYGNGEYAVHFDGDRNDTRIGEYKLRVANCATVANAKFKKGDKVVSSDGKYHGVVWDVYGGGEIAVKCEEDDPLTRRRFDQNRLKLANCSTANSVVAKAVANARAINAHPGLFDFIKKCPYKDSYSIAGIKNWQIWRFGIEWDPQKVKNPLPEVKKYLAQRLDLTKVDFSRVNLNLDINGWNHADIYFPDDAAINSAANSSAEPTVAKNGAADVLVSFTTITAKGLEKVQSRMTESDFDVWAKKVGAGDTQNVWAQLMQSDKAGFAITRPLSVTVTQL